MKRAVAFLVVILAAGLSCDGGRDGGEPNSADAGAGQGGAADKAIYGFVMDDIDGNPVKLADFRGKVLLLVNVASQCGFTKQYGPLQELYGKYGEKGLVVLGFPANNFGQQEPGSNEQIKQFCSTKYSVTFPMFAKISVKGEDIHPLYAYLTDKAKVGDFGGEITWNFNKFLISMDGDVIGRYDSKIEPMSEELVGDIEKAIAGG